MKSKLGKVIFLGFTLFLCNCVQDSKTDVVGDSLFPIQTYVDQVQSNWIDNDRRLMKYYKAGNGTIDSAEVSIESFGVQSNLFTTYAIDKPDYLDKYKLVSEEGVDTYQAIHKDLKTKSLEVFGHDSAIDSVKIKYRHKSLIGGSSHDVLISPTAIVIYRVDDFMGGKPLSTELKYVPLD